MSRPDPLTVSVVIPAYNVEAYVGDAIDSALQQTYPLDQIVVVDDGSTDRTLEIIQDYRDRYPERIEVLSGPNKGAPTARNRGLEIATGTYIQFLDADDLLLPEKIARDIEVLTAHPAPLLFGSFKRFEVGGEVSECATFTSSNPWICLARQNFGMTSANLFRASAVRRVGAWDEARPYNQDYDLMVRMLKVDSDVAFAHHVRTHIRGREGSISYDFSAPMRVARLELDQAILEHLRATGADADVIEAVEERMFLALRQLASLDLNGAVRLYRDVFPTGYAPVPGGCHTAMYCAAYHLLGFRRAERLKAALQRV